MAKEQLFKEKYCTVEMDSSNGILYAKWSGFLKIDDIRKGCGAMTEFIKSSGTKLHCSDHLELKVLTDDCKDYLTGEWFPEVESIGLKKVSALVSPNIFARSSIEDVNSAAVVNLGQLTIDTFNTQQDCEAWLLS